MGFNLFYFLKLRAKISGVIIWSKFVFFKRTQLGPDTDPCLDQIKTPQDACFFCVFFAFQNVLKYLFFEKQPKIGKKAPPKTITFDILQNTGS